MTEGAFEGAGRIARLAFRWVLAVVVGLALAGPASADHLAGRYLGQGPVEGVTIAITQTGTAVAGTISGADTGTLTATEAADGTFAGRLDVLDGRYDFTGRLAGADLRLTLTVAGSDRSIELQFLRETAATQVPGAEAGIHVAIDGRSEGPLAAAEIARRIAAGEIGPETLVWTAGMADWVRADAHPALAELFGATYFVVVDGAQFGPLTLADLRRRVAAGETGPDDLVWKSGTPDWVPARTLAELGLGAPTADGPPGRSEAEMRADAMVMGATFGILFHELGHALIGELGVPSTGPEEDAADELSALLMAAIVTDEDFEGYAAEQQAFLAAMVEYAALLWHHDAQQTREAGLSLPWYDEHSPSELRFRNTLCMIFGAAPERFRGLADRVDYPARSRQRCILDQGRRQAAWEAIVAPFERTAPDGTQRPSPGRVVVTLSRSQTETGENLRAVFEANQIFHQLGAMLSELLVWPRDLNVAFRDCREANAYYDPRSAEVIMCWEGIDYFARILLEGEGVLPQS